MSRQFYEFANASQREIELALSEFALESADYDRKLNMINNTLDFHLACAEHKVLCECGTVGDLDTLFVEAEAAADNAKKGIIESIIDGIRALFQRISNALSGENAKNLEKVAKEHPDQQTTKPRRPFQFIADFFKWVKDKITSIFSSKSDDEYTKAVDDAKNEGMTKFFKVLGTTTGLVATPIAAASVLNAFNKAVEENGTCKDFIDSKLAELEKEADSENVQTASTFEFIDDYNIYTEKQDQQKKTEPAKDQQKKPEQAPAQPQQNNTAQAQPQQNNTAQAQPQQNNTAQAQQKKPEPAPAQDQQKKPEPAPADGKVRKVSVKLTKIKAFFAWIAQIIPKMFDEVFGPVIGDLIRVVGAVWHSFTGSKKDNTEGEGAAEAVTPEANKDKKATKTESTSIFGLDLEVDTIFEESENDCSADAILTLMNEI